MSKAEILCSPESPSKVSEISQSLERFEIMPRAYSKIILHAAKYPHAAVNGLLLSSAPLEGRKMPRTLCISDAIPLFHLNEGLTPMLEVALTQIETRAASAGLAITGYYHASRSLKNTGVDIFSQRIADRIADLSPTGMAALITVNNKRLGYDLDEHSMSSALKCNSTGRFSNSVGKWEESSIVYLNNQTFAATTALLKNRCHKELVDFDNYLDDVTQDYLNVEINRKIDDELARPVPY